MTRSGLAFSTACLISLPKLTAATSKSYIQVHLNGCSETVERCADEEYFNYYER